MSNPPVPPITWVGRDAVGNVVDVTAETSGLMSPVSVSGGEQTIRLLGPFEIAHDTAGVTSFPGATIATLDAGSTVVRLWSVCTEGFSAGAGANVFVDIGAGYADGGATVYYAQLTVDGQSSSVAAAVSNREFPAFGDTNGATTLVQTHSVPMTIRAQVPLTVHIDASAALSAGTLEIYALIAEPAA